MDLFISDLDGTLLNSQQEISRKSQTIIRQLTDAGLNFTIATARSKDSVLSLISSLGILLPVIVSNGAFIYDPLRQHNIIANYIDKEMFEVILEACREVGESPLVFSCKEPEYRVYYRELCNPSIENFVRDRVYRGDRRFKQVRRFSFTEDENIYTVSLSIEKSAVEEVCRVLSERLNLLVHYHEDIYYAGYYWVEIANQNATKRNAVRFVKEYLKADRLICFGDNLNDCSMFEEADLKYAVSNANEVLKKAATAIIGSNDEDGVAIFLKSVYPLNE